MFGFLWWLPSAFYNLWLSVFQKPLKLADFTYYSLNIKKRRHVDLYVVNTNVLYFQILQLKKADTQTFLLPFIFPNSLLNFFDPCKL